MHLVHTFSAERIENQLRDSTEPVVAEFFAPGCSVCKLFAPFLEEEAEKFAGQVKVLRVNINEEPALANRHHIRLVPTLLFFREGQEVERLEGLTSPYTLQVKMAQLANVAMPN